MGADVIAWRECELQRPDGPAAFAQQIKMLSYRRVVEATVPPEERDGFQLAIVVNGAQRRLSYDEICSRGDALMAGAGVCAGCPLAIEGPLDCYQYVTYPIDPLFEELAFELFTGQLATRDSISDQLYLDIVSKQPASGTPWHVRRGAVGTLAARPEPLVYTWGGFLGRKRVDSAQLLASLFISLPSPPLVVGYARFWRELAAHIEACARAGTRRGLVLAADGAVDVEPTDDGYSTGTVIEILRVTALLQLVAPRSITDGWAVFVDG
jgi:hypothetical protein